MIFVVYVGRLSTPRAHSAPFLGMIVLSSADAALTVSTSTVYTAGWTAGLNGMLQTADPPVTPPNAPCVAVSGSTNKKLYYSVCMKYKNGAIECYDDGLYHTHLSQSASLRMHAETT